MKKSLFVLILLGFFQTSKAIAILNITVSNLNTSDINIQTRVGDGYYFEYYSHNFNIVDNTITLNICYSPYFTPVFTYKENDFLIPNINIDTNNFILVVNIYKRMFVDQTWVCDSLIDTDTETLQFSTPLNAIVTLSNSDFNLRENNQVTLFPNPTAGVINIDSKDFVETIEVYDNIGRKIKKYFSITNNAIDLSNLDDGIYFVDIVTELGHTTRKIMLRK